jgi:hypothetical protein
VPNETEYRLFVPATKNSGHPIRTDLLQSYAIRMADPFGGVTVYPASGCDHDAAVNTLRCDPVSVIAATEVEGHRQQTDAEDQAFVRALSIDLGRRQDQRDVLHERTSAATWRTPTAGGRPRR